MKIKWPKRTGCDHNWQYVYRREGVMWQSMIFECTRCGKQKVKRS